MPRIVGDAIKQLKRLCPGSENINWHKTVKSSHQRVYYPVGRNSTLGVLSRGVDICLSKDVCKDINSDTAGSSQKGKVEKTINLYN